MLNRALYVGGVVIVAIHRGTYFDYICAYVGADFVVAIMYLVAVSRTVLLRWNADFGQWRRMARIALPLGAIQIMGTIYLWMDSIMVSIICTRQQLGLYSLAFNAVVVVLSIPISLMQALIPSLVEAKEAVARHLVNRACYLLYSIGVVVAVAGVILRQDVVLALGGPRFLLASTPFAILFVTVPFTSLQTVFSYASISIDRYRPLLPVAIAALVLNVAINVILIPRFGPSGAATALLICEVISLFVTYLIFRRSRGSGSTGPCSGVLRSRLWQCYRWGSGGLRHFRR